MSKALTVKINNTRRVSFLVTFASNTVAMATANRKDDRFLLFLTYLQPFLELPLAKHLHNLGSCIRTVLENISLKKKVCLAGFRRYHEI